jgi:orotate phosphoribosyltransferase
MLSYKDSLEILKETDALLEGHFILSSGLHSSQYIQCAQLLSKPTKAEKLCISLAEKITNEFSEIDMILSPAMGGVIIGY